LTAVAAVADPEQQLAWEARQRPRAGMAAVIAGLLTLAGFLWTAVAFKDLPRSGFAQSLAQTVLPGPVGSRPSLRTPEFEFYDDRALTFIGSSVVRGIALLALAWAVTFLAVATRARRPELPRIVVYVALVGSVLLAVAAVLGGVGTVLAVSKFLDGPRTVDAAREVSNDSLLLTSNLISQLAPLAIAAGLLLTALNAMRVGLLTRFLGVLGMVCGAMAVLSQFIFAFVSAFWLIAVGLLFLGVTPGGPPPAWRTGQPEPWPSQREIAEARRAARSPASEPEAAPSPAPRRPHSGAKKRKRKRRG
jgi:hypothetical protein